MTTELLERLASIAANRVNLLLLFSELSVSQFNEVPLGYTTNLGWQLGHIVAQQQTICYVRARLSPRIDPYYIARYVHPTQPIKWIESDEMIVLKANVYNSLTELEGDLVANYFEPFQSYRLPDGSLLNNIREALQYIVTHEQEHFSLAQKIKAVVQNRR